MEIVNKKASFTTAKWSLDSYPTGVKKIEERNCFVLLTVWNKRTSHSKGPEPEEEALLVHFSWVDNALKHVLVSGLLVLFMERFCYMKRM